MTPDRFHPPRKSSLWICDFFHLEYFSFNVLQISVSAPLLSVPESLNRLAADPPKAECTPTSPGTRIEHLLLPPPYSFRDFYVPPLMCGGFRKQLNATVPLSDKDFDVSRASGHTSHANHLGPSRKNHSTHSDIFFGPPIFNFPPYFFKVADLHFKTFLGTNSTVRHCWRCLRPLKMLPIDSPSNFTLDGMFASHFRKKF